MHYAPRKVASISLFKNIKFSLVRFSRKIYKYSSTLFSISNTRRSKGKHNFIKMISDKILKCRKLIGKWEYRILAAFDVSPCTCSNCNKNMKFYDIVYTKYGSMREHLKNKIIKSNKEKLEETLQIYAITKGIIYGKINPTLR